MLFEIGREIALPMLECALTPEDLYQADEVFITSTTREVQPVRQIEGHRMPQAPGPVTARLAGAFSDYVRAYFARGSLTRTS